MERHVELLNIECLGKPLKLEGSLAGWQQLFWDGQLVSQKAASSDGEGLKVHQFQLQSANQHSPIEIRLEVDVRWQPFLLDYCLLADEQLLAQGQRTENDMARQAPPPHAQASKPGPLGLVSLLFKLFKSAKVIKVVLAGASIAAYSWLFSFQFALALLVCLMFHEYGHIRAMQYFGMKTKGIYLIPFMGGLALSDDKINTRWQDVVISLMGPFFGLLLSLLALLIYHLTDNPFFAALSGFNALLNLFNLLPVLPLDGGHALKSISFSQNRFMGLAICGAGLVLGVVLSYQLGLTLLGFLLAIGGLEIFMEWKQRLNSHLIPLDRYGQMVSAGWYLLTVAALVGVIWHLAGSGDAMLGLPLQILKS
ncbi:site-2 protease family protein [Shewanella sp. YIC-542]|uniref:site-2 protease family protein n=1 Tax=Shewanella mytili TaxID=3377111 RepID=UPI00398F196B